MSYLRISAQSVGKKPCYFRRSSVFYLSESKKQRIPAVIARIAHLKVQMRPVATTGITTYAYPFAFFHYKFGFSRGNINVVGLFFVLFFLYVCLYSRRVFL